MRGQHGEIRKTPRLKLLRWTRAAEAANRLRQAIRRGWITQ
jgi:hypothetical protein